MTYRTIYSPLYEEYLELAKKFYPAFVERLEQSLSVGMVPDIVEGMMTMESNLGPARYKALDHAFRNADNDNLVVLEKLTGMTKKQWGQVFWGWSK